MPGRDYKRLPIEEFGRHLIESGDLDPVYIALPKAMDNTAQMYRWLIAYWCFYHCGVASHMSEHEGNAFWTEMLRAAHNSLEAPVGGRWPRGHERRHARGDQGVKMVTHLRQLYGRLPEKMVEDMVDLCQGGVEFSVISRHVRQHTLFGPWIAFKVGDMLERVLECPVSFVNADVFMFKDPVKATLMMWRDKYGLPETARPKDELHVIREAVDYLKHEFRELSAPPNRDRPVDLQEVETVLCKWKSSMNGHYGPYNDINEITAGLEGWGETAMAFRAAMPPGGNSWEEL